MAKKTAGSGKVYQIKVTLDGSKPPIWRRLLVLGDDTLEDLNETIQVAMGWGGGHLHAFDIKGKQYGPSDDDFDRDMDMLDESKVRLDKVLAEKAKIRYTYDFGDNWDHTILVEKVLAVEPGAHYPSCVTGKRCCPPDDCGGIWGYSSFLEAIAAPDHPEHEEMMEWAGGDFDPEAFSVEEVNEMLGHPG